MPISRSGGGYGPAASAALTSFTTTFAGTEDPLSESGAWVSPATSVWNTLMQKIGGRAFGSASAVSANDSVSFLAGSQWLPHQVLTGTVYRSGAIGSSEIEHHLRSTYNATQLFTYEVDFVAASNFVAIVKWTGNQGSFLNLPNTNGTTGACTLANGDVITSEITDNGLTGASRVVTITVKQNGNLVCQADDSFAISGSDAYATGSCGIGADDGGAENGSLGWEDFSAVTT